MAVSLAGSGKLQLSESIGGAFGGVLGTVPVVNDGRAEVVTQGHRGVGVPGTPTLTQGAIAARGDPEDRSMTSLCWISTDTQRSTCSAYLEESSTKVVQILFLMILGIQLCEDLTGREIRCK